LIPRNLLGRSQLVQPSETNASFARSPHPRAHRFVIGLNFRFQVVYGVLHASFRDGLTVELALLFVWVDSDLNTASSSAMPTERKL